MVLNPNSSNFLFFKDANAFFRLDHFSLNISLCVVEGGPLNSHSLDKRLIRYAQIFDEIKSSVFTSDVQLMCIIVDEFVGLGAKFRFLTKQRQLLKDGISVNELPKTVADEYRIWYTLSPDISSLSKIFKADKALGIVLKTEDFISTEDVVFLFANVKSNFIHSFQIIDFIIQNPEVVYRKIGLYCLNGLFDDTNNDVWIIRNKLK